MDLKRLDAFLAIVDTGTFAAAADTLRMGQSSVSASIRILERDLGATLFDRSARTAVLTSAGRALVPRARALVREVALTRSLVAEAERRLTGTLRLGVISSTHPVPLPGLLLTFTRAHPSVALQVMSDSVGTHGLVDRLHRGDLDMAIIANPFPHSNSSGLVTEELATGDLVCITAPGDPLAGHHRVTLADLQARTWIEAPVGQANRTTTDAAFAAAGVARSVSLEIGQPSDVPDYVAAGIGVAFVPDFLVRGRRDVRALPVPDVRLHWSIALARLSQRDDDLVHAAWNALTAAAGRRRRRGQA